MWRLWLFVGGAISLLTIGIVTIARSEEPIEWLVYSTDTALYRQNFDTGERYTLVDRGFQLNVEWSPNGQWAVLTEYGVKLNAVPMHTTTTRDYPLIEKPVLDNLTLPFNRVTYDYTENDEVENGLSISAWSPDSQWVLYSDWETEERSTGLYRIRRDGSQIQRLTHFSTSEWFNGWTSDGQWLIFSAGGRDEATGGPFSNIYRIHPNGSDVEPVTQLEGNNEFVAVSSNNEWVYYEHRSSRQQSLRRVRLNGRDDQLVLSGGYFYTLVSPNRRWILVWPFRSESSYPQPIMIQSDTSTYQILPYSPNSSRALVWSSNSHWLIFTFEYADGSVELNRIQPDGSEFLTLLSGYNDIEVISFSPDGKWLLVDTSGDNGWFQYHLINLDTGKEENQLEFIDDEYPYIRGWSSDGEWLIGILHEVIDGEGYSRLYRVRPAGDHFEIITEPAYRFDFVGFAPTIDMQLNTTLLLMIGTLLLGGSLCLAYFNLPS